MSKSTSTSRTQGGALNAKDKDMAKTPAHMTLYVPNVAKQVMHMRIARKMSNAFIVSKNIVQHRKIAPCSNWRSI